MLDAGHCGCGGVAAPTLAWSPDGQQRRGGDHHAAPSVPWGVYLVRPTAAAIEQMASGCYAALAWQPLRG